MITTTNSVLSAVLFFASTAKTQLIRSIPGMYAFAREGLQLPVADRKPVREDVVAIGSCLQVVVTGAAMS